MWLHAFARLASRRRALEPCAGQCQPGLPAGPRRAITGRWPDGDHAGSAFSTSACALKAAATGASSVRGDFSEPLMVLLGARRRWCCSSPAPTLETCCWPAPRRATVRWPCVWRWAPAGCAWCGSSVTESLCLAGDGRGRSAWATALVLRGGPPAAVSPTPASPCPLRSISGTLAFAFGLTLVEGLLLGLLPAVRITKKPKRCRGCASRAAASPDRRVASAGQGLSSSDSSRCRCRCWSARACWCRRWSTSSGSISGIPKTGSLTVRVDPQPAGYEPAWAGGRLRRLLAGIRALPGVRAATYSNNGLFGGSDNGDQITVEGYTPKGEDDTGSRYDADWPGILRDARRAPAGSGARSARTICAGGTNRVRHQRDVRRAFLRRPPSDRLARHTAVRRSASQLRGRGRGPRFPSGPAARAEIEHRFYVPATQPAAPASAA